MILARRTMSGVPGSGTRDGTHSITKQQSPTTVIGHPAIVFMAAQWLLGIEKRQSLIKRKTTRITIETDRVLTIQWQTGARVRCTQCCTDVEAVPLDAVATTDNGEPTTFDQWLQSPGIHLVSPGEGSHAICLPSLIRALSAKVLS